MIYVLLIVKISSLYIITVFCTSFLHSVTLQSVFDAAGPGNGYDKYVILAEGMIYTGEAGVYEGNVFVEGNGAIVDLNNGLGIWVYAEEEYPASLDIEFITIITIIPVQC